jgi:CelD/BcsL family acetyltransferase involved in cellulose biosynthesis
MDELRFDVIQSEAGFEALAGSWTELLYRVPGYQYIQSYEWCHLCWTCYSRPGGHSLIIIAIWDAERLVGVWPFRLSHLLFARYLHPLGCGHGDTAQPLLDPGIDTVETARGLRQALNPLADVVDLPMLPSETNLAQILQKGGWGVSCQTSDVTQVDLHGAPTWEAFMTRYSSNMRRAMRSDRRRLQTLGVLEFECVSDLDAQAEAIAWTFNQKRDWLVRHGLRERWYEGDMSIRFLMALSAYRDDRDGMEIFTLKLNGQIIASRICTREARSVAGLAMTFDPLFGRFSPGMLITHDVLEWCFARKLNFNMGVASNELKARWGTGDTKYQSISVILTRNGQISKWLAAIKASVGRAIRRPLGHN